MEKCRKPCSSCPWGVETSKKFGPEAAGAFQAERMLGQVYGNFWLPCHQDYKNFTHEQLLENPDQVAQCAGAAIFRANVGTRDLNPRLLKLPPSDLVFQSPQAFFAYHKQVSRVLATYYLADGRISSFVLNELDAAEESGKIIPPETTLK